MSFYHFGSDIIRRTKHFCELTALCEVVRQAKVYNFDERLLLSEVLGLYHDVFKLEVSMANGSVVHVLNG